MVTILSIFFIISWVNGIGVQGTFSNILEGIQYSFITISRHVEIGNNGTDGPPPTTEFKPHEQDLPHAHDQVRITSIVLPDNARLGVAFPITIRAENLSGNRRRGGIVVSFPDWDPATNMDLSNKGSATWLKLFSPQNREIVYDRQIDGYRVPDYLVVENWDVNWEYGEVLEISFQVTPRSTGTFIINVRSALCRLDDWEPKNNIPNTPPDGLDYPIDGQQHWPVQQFTIEVFE